MKYLPLVTAIILGVMIPDITMSHGENVRGGMGMMGGGMMGRGMMGYGTMGYDMMMDDAGCPMMMNMAVSADYLLSYKDELELSKIQLSKLKEIRSNYQKDAVSLRAELNLAMLQLHNLLSEDQLNIVKIRAASQRIEEVESELRTKSIETYISAKLLLTRDQLKKVNEMGLFDMSEMHGSEGMMMR